MTTEQTAGTPAQDDGDAAAQTPTTGTPAADGRDAASGEPDYKALHLANKSTIEKMKAELEEVRGQRASQNGADEDGHGDEGAGDDDAANGDEGLTRDDLARLQDYANRGDVVAKAQLVNYRRQLELARDVRDSFHLRDIGDKGKQKRVLAHYAKNRHRLGDVKAAAAEIAARDLETENTELRTQLDLAKKQPPKDVVRTHSREVSATEANERELMTVADFDRQEAELRRQGRHDEARALQHRLNTGAIDFKD